MVICNLKGGLGNQMFQYAVARSMAKDRHNILIDLSFLKKNNVSIGSFTARKFELNLFKNIRFKFINRFALNFYLSNSGILKVLRILLQYKKVYVINDESEQYEDGHNIIYIDGYFQNPLLFDSIRAILLKDFSFPVLPKYINNLAKLIESKNAVSIHVRRGDYLNQENNDYHGLLPISYYKSAVEKIIELNKESCFFIFSDDSEWCKLNFSFIENEKYFISDKNNPNWIDLKLMTLCKHFIIANSSFSWWGAWLSEHDYKTVIAPRNWYKNRPSKIVPKEWITI